MERNPSIGVIACWTEKFGEDQGTIGCKKTVEEWNELIYNYISATSLFRKACWREVGGYDEQMPNAEDWEFWIRILTTRWQRYVIEEVLFRYRVRSESLYHSRSFSASRAAGIYTYKKHRKLYKKYFWKIIQEFLYLLCKDHRLMNTRHRYHPHPVVLACRDNLHPLVYRGVRMAYRWGFLPVYMLLREIRNKVIGDPSAITSK